MWQVPGSSRVKDALGDTIPPAPPVLHSLFPADAHFPKIFLDDIFPVLSRSTWPPPGPLGSHVRACRGMVIHSWKMSKPSQTSVSHKNAFQLWKCSCLSDFLICYFVLPGNPQDTSLHLWCAASSLFSFGWLTLATALHCWATWRGLVLHKALFSLVNWFSCSFIICVVLRKRQLLCRFVHCLLGHSSQWLICSCQDSRRPLLSQW